jgi:ribulose-phosphate 3-epimerase
MTEEPIDYVRELVEIKDELPIHAVISQVERMGSQSEYIQELKAQGWKTGLSLDLYTPVSAINKNTWQDLDIIQLMTIESGFQGQKFKQNALEKIVEIKKQAKKDIEIIADGGVKLEQLEILAKHQVSGVAVGSGIWQTNDPIAALHQYS